MMARHAFTVLLILLAASTIGWPFVAAQAGEHHHHGAHVHGLAQLNVALEGKNLYIEFLSPAANILGFEHAPETQDQREGVEVARNTLKDAEALFKLTAAAGARLVDASIASDIDHDTHHGDEGGHDNDENHEESKAGSGQEHHDADKHEGEAYSDFRAVYRFSCQNPDNLSTIEVRLFELFPGIEEIEVQILTATKQTALKLTAREPKFRL